MLEQFDHEFWIAGGPDVAFAGFPYPTRMAVLRLSDGGLFIWSPVPLTDSLRAQVDALGAVRHIIAPNSLHHFFIPEWVGAYPDAKVYAAPGLRKKRKDIEFDGDLGGAPPPAWVGEIDQAVLSGNLITTEVVFFHVASGTVIFTDLLQQHPADWVSGWRAFCAKWGSLVGSEPSVPRVFRLTFTDRRATRVALKKILDWPARKVLMAHGPAVTKDCNAFIGRAFAWL